MPKYCLNYDTGDYEWIDKNGYSIDRGEYVYNWDDSEYRREAEEEERRREEEEERQREEEEKRYSWGNDDDDDW